jgi:hypothetical protein
MKRVVSFSLWGTSKVYLQGAVDAVDQVSLAYPEWECWFYLAKDVPDYIRSQLASKGARVLDGPPWGPWAGMYWRFLAAADPDVEVVISRDVDTLILEREVRAVDEWLASGRVLHIIRDHPKHEMPIMGGMWGCRASEFRNIKELICKFGKFERYGSDQEFLSKIIYPNFVKRAWIHSECIRFHGEIIHPFPTRRKGDEVIGMAIRDNELIDLQIRFLHEWKNAGYPILKRPHPSSLAGKIRILMRGRWPGDSLPKVN